MVLFAQALQELSVGFAKTMMPFDSKNAGGEVTNATAGPFDDITGEISKATTTKMAEM